MTRPLVQSIRSASRRTAALGVLALVLLQIAAAGHQFDHADETAGESCEYCAQFDRLGDVPATAVTLAPLSQTERLPSVAWAPVQAQSQFPRFLTRAPPVA